MGSLDGDCLTCTFSGWQCRVAGEEDHSFELWEPQLLETTLKKKMHLDLALMATFPDKDKEAAMGSSPGPWSLSVAAMGQKAGRSARETASASRVSWELLKFFFKRRKAGPLPRE